MTFWDILIIVIFTVVIPIYSSVQYRRLLREDREWLEKNRSTHYRNTIGVQWVICAAIFVLWVLYERSWENLGFSYNIDNGFWIGVAITLAVLGFFGFQLWQAASGDQKTITKLKEEFGDTIPFLPRTTAELRHFYGVSWTAGIVEEVFFRGYLIWAFTQFLPLWAAAIAVILLFAFAHSYQGWQQVPALLIISTILMGLFLISGSLWLPMILHVFGDILQGKLAFTILGKKNMLAESS